MAAKVLPFKRPYFTVDNDLIDVHMKAIGAYGFTIYAYLRRCRNQRTRQCNPSVQTIARDLGFSESAVKVSLKKLIKAGLISSEAQWDPAGDRTSNQYWFPECVPAVPGGGGSRENPPWVFTQPTGGALESPKQSESEQKEKNEEKPARAEDKGEEKPPQTPAVDTPVAHPDRQPCSHPPGEVGRLDDRWLCHHCWTLLEDPKATTVRPSVTEEGQAQRATQAA